MIDSETCKKKSVEMFIQAGLYKWCSCGLSNTQPFCNDSHFGTGKEPRDVRFDEEKLVVWCGCKNSSASPFCDNITSENKGMKID